jgi:hypothetical protein
MSADTQKQKPLNKVQKMVQEDQAKGIIHSSRWDEPYRIRTVANLPIQPDKVWNEAGYFRIADTVILMLASRRDKDFSTCDHCGKNRVKGYVLFYLFTNVSMLGNFAGKEIPMWACSKACAASNVATAIKRQNEQAVKDDEAEITQRQNIDKQQLNGWLSPSGVFTACGHMEHQHTATDIVETLGLTARKYNESKPTAEYTVQTHGYARLSSSHGWEIDTHRQGNYPPLTNTQKKFIINWCIDHDAPMPELSDQNEY